MFSNCYDVYRSMLRVVVDDGEATSTFELPDYLLQGITSLSYNDLVRLVFIFFLCYSMNISSDLIGLMWFFIFFRVPNTL